MTDLTIYGDPRSSYVRTVRMTAVEKGVPYILRPVAPGTEEIKALHRAIPKVLKKGLKNLGTSLGTGDTNFYSVARHRGRNKDELKVFRRTDLPCQRCKTKIERIIVGQRSTHICAKCQKIK